MTERCGQCFRTAAAIAASIPLVFGLPAQAQDGWNPTVATVPGGTLHVPMPGHVGLTPPAIDPRFFPSPQYTEPAPRKPTSLGPWSPIETGALPSEADDGPRARVPPLAKRDSLSPIRPLKPALAAAEAAKSQTGKAADPKAKPETGDAVPAAEPGADSVFKKPGPLETLPPDATAAQQYCFNTVESASDARFAWQAKKIQDMEAELDKRSKQLEAKTQEYKDWLARRDDFARKAQEKLVGFYARMRPDAAAVQLATVEEDLAAAVMMKLDTKVASAIMNEMDPDRAAKVAAIISGAARVPPQKRVATPADEPTPQAPPAEGIPAAGEPRS